MLRTRSAAAAFAVVTVATLAAQPPADRTQVLEQQIGRIFASAEYQTPRFGPARWMGGGAYTVLETSTERPDASDIVRYDAVSGARTVLIPGSALVPAGARAALAIDDYIWSPDGTRLLIFTNTQRVWRQNTRGDYWVFDRTSRRLQQLGTSAPPSSLMFAKFSPDGRHVGYVRGNNIYVERLADGEVRALTTDGSETTINGTSDWVYEEELGVRDGFQWSPDGLHIAYWQFDTTGVGIFSLINTTDTLYPVITRIPYPKVGTTNSAVRIGVVSVNTAQTRWMKTPGDPRETYLARMEWTDEWSLAIQQLNRLQNQNDFLLADTRSGEVRSIFRDSSSTWVDVMDHVEWIDDGEAFLWLSERSGWQHVYRVPRSGGPPVPLTRFEADVTDLVGLDEAAGWLYFIASPDKSTERYLYRTPLDGSTMPTRVTPRGEGGWHSYTMAPNGRLAFHTVSAFDKPPVMDLVELPSHRSVRPLTDPSALVAKLVPVLKPPVEFISVDVGGGVTLDGYMLKPASFDPARRYPVIVHVYGEPAGQIAVNRWGGATMLFHRALADAGYIVVSVDNRGTPAPRGAAWRKVVYGRVGELSAKEQDAAIRALAARHSFIDRTRIGIWGWSGGGSNTLNAMFRHPDTYAVGVSVAPVPDQTLYDTIYQERYMGLPKDNPDGYRAGSPIHFAEGLKGHLLLIHGSGDDNVHYQGTERLANRLIALGKPFDLMVYPNRTHAIAEGRGTTAHVYRLVARYFLQHLAPGPR